MRRMLHTTSVKWPCTCHDPTVFGHLTCTRAETQPNNTPPRPPDTTSILTRINAGTLAGLSVTCGGVIYDEINRINQHMDQLNNATRVTTQHIEAMTALLHEDMHHHDTLEDMSACPRCAPRHG